MTTASATLTPRELEILTWTGQGKTAQDIGDILQISKRTVDAHVQSAIEKLGANNKTHAVAKLAAAPAVTAAEQTQERVVERVTVNVPSANETAEIVKRRVMSLREIDDQDAVLRSAYWQWRDRKNRRQNLLPAVNTIDRIALLTGTLENTHLFDVVDQLTFRIEARRIGGVADRMRQFLRHKIEDIELPALRLSLNQDYSGVIFSGVPEYSHVVARLGQIEYSYSRLVLPFSEDGRRVKQLMVQIHKRPFDDWKV